jgi:hypothetical protein
MTMATFSSWNSIKKAHHVDFVASRNWQASHVIIHDSPPDLSEEYNTTGVEQKLLILPEYFNWCPVVSGVRVHVQLQVVMSFVTCCNIHVKRCSVGPYPALSLHLFCWGLCFISYLNLFMNTDAQHGFLTRWCPCRLTVAWWVNIVKYLEFGLWCLTPL